MPNSKSQKLQVLAGIVTAWGLSALFVALGVSFGSQVGLTFASGNDALAFTIAIASLTLVAGIGWAARTRHFTSNIDGSAPDASSELDLTLRYVTNTSEQLLLFALACVSVFYANEAIATKLLPVLGLWFVIARAMFYIGYKITPVARSVGFAATFHPTIVLFGYVIFKLFA